MFDRFDASTISTDECTLFVRIAGSGSPLLLLHGFPETHLMWRDVAPILARDFTVICADLRGYGQSGCPASAPDHAPYSKRVMARDMVHVMRQLGFDRFAVAGHDRGGRVAYRMALDHPSSVTRVSVLDILPTATVWDRAAATIDRVHDADDRAARRGITCPLQVLWSAQGGLENWYSSEGGPLALWRAWADEVSGGPITGGHFFPEE